MAYREITVIEIEDVLRLWLRNEMRFRPIAETVDLDRQTVERQVLRLPWSSPAALG